MVFFFILRAEPSSLQEWVLSLLVVPGEETDEEEDDMDAEIDGLAPTATRIIKIQTAYRHADALTALHICVTVLGEITQLIVDSSAETCHLPSNLSDRLSLLGMKLEACSKADPANLVMCCYFSFSEFFLFHTLMIFCRSLLKGL